MTDETAKPDTARRVNPYYEDEYVTLYHGDCREVTAWLEADVLVTDPPYGRNWRQSNTKGHANSNARAGIANDQDTRVRDDALELWGTRRAVVFGDLMLPPPNGCKLTCVYHKSSGAEGLRGAIGGVRRDCEAIYLVGDWPSGLGGRSSLFSTASMLSGSAGLIARSGGHPHTKPRDVLAPLIELSDGMIADPFAGSGSTLVAAKFLGRKAIGVELEERYCEIAAKRLSQGVLDLFGEAS